MQPNLTRNGHCRLLPSLSLLQPCPNATRRAILTSRRWSLELPDPLDRRPKRRTTIRKIIALPKDPKQLAPDDSPNQPQLESYIHPEARIPDETVWLSLLEFMEHKKKTRKTFSRTQARLMGSTLDHLFVAGSYNVRQKDMISLLWDVFEVVLRDPLEDTNDMKEHLALAIFLFEELCPRFAHKSDTYFMPYIRALAMFQRAQEAGDKLAEFCRDNRNRPGPVKSHGEDPLQPLWLAVLQGLARESNEKELLRLFEVAWKQDLLCYTPAVHDTMTRFFTHRNKVNETIYWFEFDDFPVNMSPAPHVMHHTFEFAIRMGQEEWMERTLLKMVDKRPRPPTYDAVCLWWQLTAHQVVNEGREESRVALFGLLPASPPEPRRDEEVDQTQDESRSALLQSPTPSEPQPHMDQEVDGILDESQSALLESSTSSKSETHMDQEVDEILDESLSALLQFVISSQPKPPKDEISVDAASTSEEVGAADCIGAWEAAREAWASSMSSQPTSANADSPPMNTELSVMESLSEKIGVDAEVESAPRPFAKQA